MPSDSRLVSKIPKWANRDAAPGVKYDTATFVGIVKNNLDPARSGRLQVFIPDLGGNDNDPSCWKTVIMRPRSCFLEHSQRVFLEV